MGSECAKNGHKGGTATCKDLAICEVCNETYGELDPNNHVGDVQILPKKAATCTKTGLTEGKICKTCNVTFVEQKVVKALGHSMKYHKAVDATLTKNGTREYYECISKRKKSI